MILFASHAPEVVLNDLCENFELRPNLKCKFFLSYNESRLNFSEAVRPVRNLSVLVYIFMN